MKTVLFLFGVFAAFGAGAQESCPQSKSAVKDLQSLCDELNKSNQSHCKVSAPAKTESVPAITYGILSASGKMKSLFEKMEGMQKAFLAEAGGCPGGCSRINAPVVEISTQPTAVVKHTSCPDQYTALKLSSSEQQRFAIGQKGDYFKKSFRMRADAKKCQEAATTYAQETLMGENELGSFLEDSKCKSPCSYSSVIRLKTQSAGKGECAVDLELVVQCGSPKKDREWQTQAKLTKTFSCEVAQ
ncbi:hypothetical protein ACNQKP_10180 [Bdellovibrio bacteriovorus]|uniref:hypothetical protein n=1 Tax=Bdellovibrio bacteriovorus TaxID=959 RepID=UPI003AA952A2